MADARDLLRRYVRSRQALEEPELFLKVSGRSPTLAHARQACLEDSGPVSKGRKTPSEKVKRRSGRAVSVSRPVRAIPAATPGTPVIARLAREADAEEIRSLPDLPTLRAVAESCSRCPLHQTRTSVVFADGSASARVACVGEAPGQYEDETGLPFVGRAGKLLDRLLLSVGMSREEVFICNVLKCRPPGNRNPVPEEIDRCSPFLVRQIELLEPEVIVAFGTFAAQTLLGSREAMRRLRGRMHLYDRFPLIATYHPAALLRNPAWTRAAWEDLQLMRRILDGDPPTSPEAGDADRIPSKGVSKKPPTADSVASSLQLSFGDDHG